MLRAGKQIRPGLLVYATFTQKGVDMGTRLWYTIYRK